MQHNCDTCRRQTEKLSTNDQLVRNHPGTVAGGVVASAYQPDRGGCDETEVVVVMHSAPRAQP